MAYGQKASSCDPLGLWGKSTPNQNLAWLFCLERYLKNDQYFFWKLSWLSWSKLSEELKNAIKMWNYCLVNNSRTAWPTENLMSFLSFSDNLLQDAYIIPPW